MKNAWCLLLLWMAVASCRPLRDVTESRVLDSEAKIDVRHNGRVEFSEDPRIAAKLESALQRFLLEARAASFTPQSVELAHVAEHRFFFEGMKTSLQREQNGFAARAPVLMKSYPVAEGRYAITLALSGERRNASGASEEMLWKIVELEARPRGDDFRFYCRFEAETRDFTELRIDDVTFCARGPIDAARARRFVDFRKRLCARTGVPATPLRYYKFEGLAELLEAHGLVYDRRKCNFLRCDLGFGDAGGTRFVTGMNREDNLRDYVYAHFRHQLPREDELYRPILEGLAVCYGKTWGGVSLAQMKERFRRAYAERPDMDFLEEFRKGRKVSVQRHFTFYFIGALICEDLLAQDRFDGIVTLLYSGAKGERFFAKLQQVLGMHEGNFHARVLRMMQAR